MTSRNAAGNGVLTVFLGGRMIGRGIPTGRLEVFGVELRDSEGGPPVAGMGRSKECLQRSSEESLNR